MFRPIHKLIVIQHLLCQYCHPHPLCFPPSFPLSSSAATVVFLPLNGEWLDKESGGERTELPSIAVEMVSIYIYTHTSHEFSLSLSLSLLYILVETQFIDYRFLKDLEIRKDPKCLCCCVGTELLIYADDKDAVS